MISRIEIAGIHGTDLDKDVEKYALKKFGRLDKYMPLRARRSVHIEVKLSEENSKKKDRHMCEAIVHLPSGQVTAKESTLNIYAAIDIVEAKLKNQLRKYKEKHKSHRTDRKGLLSRYRNKEERDFRGSQN